MNARSTAMRLLTAHYRRGRRTNSPKLRTFPGLSKPSGATYIICTNPRSGSWLLSEGLGSTPVAGNPREWFNPMEEEQQRARWRMEHSSDLTFRQYLRLAQRLSSTSNGVSGTKLHYYQFADLPRKMSTVLGVNGLTPSQTLTTFFPRAKYIWLTRRDKARQAISYILASRTDVWWRIGDAAGVDPDGAEFDPHLIARGENALKQNEIHWNSFFTDNQLQPLVVHYEDLVEHLQETIVSVLTWLGIPRANAIAPSRLQRQSNAINEDWIRRYAAFQNRPESVPVVPEQTYLDEPRSDQRESEYEKIGEHWKQWIGQSKALRVSDEAVLETLVNNGFNRAAGVAELRNAARDPFLMGAAATVRHFRRGATVLSALGRLASLDSRLKHIARRPSLTREEFRDSYYAANRPVVLTGLMADWRAMTAWTPDYLKKVAGDHMVEVMAGRNRDPHYEKNGHLHRTTLKFADYIDMVYSGKVTNDYYLVANNLFFNRPEMQPLLADISAFPAYLRQISEGRQCFLWFGPSGTVTPLHRDTSNILMAQVAGRKRYRLIPSWQWDSVYNREGVFSELDCDRPDLVRFPKFRQATVIDVVVQPGEALFVPVGWWHDVRALDVSMTVSFTAFVFPNYFRWEA